MITSKLKAHSGDWIDWLIIGSLTASVGILLVGLLSWQGPFGGQLQLEVGEVAPHDVVSPRQITYESEVLTERARERAAQNVPDQYDSPDGRVRRQQIEQAREILDFMTIVRSDAYATPALQADYLAAVNDLNLTPELTQQILAISPEEWPLVVEEVPATLDRVMREEIRESNLSLVRRRAPALVMAELSEPAATVTVELVRALVRPNSLLNQARTDELRERARSEVPPQPVTLERGEIIVRAGDIARPEDVEALTQIGLLQDEWNWWVTVRSLLFTVVLLAVMGGTLYRLRPRTIRHVQEFGLLVVMVVVWLLAAKAMLAPHDWLPYLFPLAALGMLVAVLLDLRVAVVTIIGFGVVAHFLARNNVPLLAYLTLGSLVGAILLGRAERLTAFLWAGVVVAACNLFVVAAFWAPFEQYTASRLLQLLLVVLLNGGLSASIAMIGYLVLGNLFGITTSLQLTELSRPTHPLLRQLLLKASGTYHHTIVVSNLAERAAAAIGADAFLTRVGAYYHDIGKTVRPYFFSENILDDNSPHDKLDPLTSAQIIISHISDGIDLANKYRLPPRIQDFIREHHGRTLVKYFYIQAQHEAGADEVVDELDYRYPGPSPRSKETAILFLADACEAAVRAVRPATREDLEALVNRLIDERVAEGELNDSNLTFRELQITKEVFLQVLQGVHHPRIQYPEDVVQKVRAAQGDRLRGVSGESQPGGARLPLPGGVEEPASI
ncbi:MAG TPA: HDIG domain-containing protein [Caldilineaceae bacterium]|nr:HDIG domain-containing protein [Caldilineaceae bacterium]